MTARTKKTARLGQTPSMTVGPFFHFELSGADYGRRPLVGAVLFPDAAPRVRLTGKMLDERGKPVDDGLVEIWQPDAAGKFPGRKSPSFSGLGRCASGADGGFAFDTVKPGQTRPDSAPHIAVAALARGTTNCLFTRVYFPEETEANRTDAVLLRVPPARRKTLIAKRRQTPDGTTEYIFNIRLRGKDETVFLDF